MLLFLAHRDIVYC